MSPDEISFGGVQINQTGSGNIGQQFNSWEGRGADPLSNLPDDAMARFIRATAESLAVLGLSPAAYSQAGQTLEELRVEAAEGRPAQKRLHQLASTLHRVVEEAAGSALGAAVLGLWHP